ncbi:MAG: hypothetical protein J6K48_15790 [Lachnospiraceae bacterium]|nr:hypothetical protein [Lachnospiraceae bacterium]
MGKNSSEKEKILRSFFGEHESSPLVLEPDKFFLLKKNGILDADVMLQLQSEVESMIGDGCFALIDREEVNAFAMEKDGIPVIALYAGAVKKILCAASVLMLSDAFLPEVGDMAACYHDISSDMCTLKTNDEKDSVLKMTVSGDPCRENLGYMIACLAIHFVVYHEVGHHENGHVKKLKEKYNLYYSETPYTWISDEYLEERKRMELEADMYAVDMLIEKIDSLMESWSKYLDMDITYSEMFQLIVPALVIVKESLPTEVSRVEEIEKSYYLPNIIRISIIVMVIASQPHIKNVVYPDILELFTENEEFRVQFEELYGIKVFDDNSQLTKEAYEKYYSLMIADTEQLYADIFVGNHLRTTFLSDVKAMNWFLYQYK